MVSNLKPLKELVTIKGGKRLPKGEVLQTVENNHPYIRVRDMGNRYIPRRGLEYVPEDVFPKISRYIVKENDVIISIVGTVGLVSIIDKRFHHASQTENCAKLSGLSKEDAKYLYYYLISSSGKQEISTYTVGAVQPKLPLYGLESISVPWFDESKRKAIAHILGSLDDKIELNLQMNETLEAMAQAFFKSWFVDFDPVIDNALEAGNSIPDELLDRAEQRKKIKKNDNNHAIRSLFPNEFEFSEAMGWTPKGWKIKTVSDVTSEIIDHRGKTPKKLGGDWSESGYPAISAKNIKNNRIVRPDTIRFVDKNIYGKWMKIPLKEGDVLMTSEAPLGELYYLNSKVDYLLSQRLYGIRADGVNCTGSYLFYWFQTEIGSASLQNRATGTTVLGIKQSELRKIGVLCPCLGILEKFEDFSKKYLEKIDSNEILLSQLSNLRDTLLPKLMSGEIRIPEAEALVEDV